MKSLFTLICLLVSNIAFSQTDWWCVQPAAKNYFINDNNYLRGIRIDSTKTIGTNTVLYPFRSPRGYYIPAQLLKPSGSWLGDTVIIAPGGVHYFNNFWGDTVTIKANAALNDSWMLYDDTTNGYYTATVTDADTATVLGTLDSVKEITLTAWTGGGITATDLLHNAKLVLSKTHGLVQAFDLFMFPLREPGQNYKAGFDYLLDKSGGFLFKQIDFRNPDNLEIYDFSVGDVFEYRADGPEGPWMSTIERLVLDEVVQKTVNPGSVEYRFTRWTYNYDKFAFPVNYSTVPSYFIKTANATPLLNMNLMPEEWGRDNFIYYNPEDTTFCETRPSYSLRSNFIDNTGNVAAIQCGYSYEYKQKFGQTTHYYCWDASFASQYDKHLVHTRRNGTPCRTYLPLEIEQPLAAPQFDVYPNPSNGDVTIKQNAPGSQKATVIIYNLQGQEVYSTHGIPAAGRLQLHLPDGVYYLKYAAGDQQAIKAITIIN